jgi:hypothetical protein
MRCSSLLIQIVLILRIVIQIVLILRTVIQIVLILRTEDHGFDFTVRSNQRL